MNVTIIIPAFNEELIIGVLVSEIKKQYPEHELIVVNDGSGDNTAQVARDAGARVISHPYNIGNGAAIKTGIRAASGDILVFMDGDGQHDPQDITRLLDHFPEYDMVVGERSVSDQASIFRAFGNSVYNKLASYVAKFPVLDLTSGFRAVKSHIARNFLYMLPNTYSSPTTLTLGTLRSGWSVKYVPISAKERKQGNSNISLFKDGVRFFMIITRICTLYSPFRIFLPVSLFTFLLGIAYYLYTFLSEGRFTNMSLLLFTTSVLIFMIGLVSEQVSQMRFDKSESEIRIIKE